MAYRKFDSVQQYATGTGPGALTLGAAFSAKFRTLQAAGIANGDTTHVRIQHETIDAEWEIVEITYATGGTITRTFDSDSSSATGSLINFSAGNKIVSAVPIAADGVVSSADIIAALSLDPAVIPNGTAAAPGLALAADPTTGIFSPDAAPHGGRRLGFAQNGKKIATLNYRVDAGGNDNAWLMLGTGQAIPDTGFDSYMSTIGVQTSTIAGGGTGGARYVGLNIGSARLIASDTTTKAGMQLMMELDKLDLEAGAGPVTYALAAGVRIRAPVPATDVTVTTSYALTFTRPAGGAGTTNTFSFIHLPTAVGGATTSRGIHFTELYNGGSIFSDAGVDLDVLVGGNIKLKAGSGGTGFLSLTAAGSAPILQAGSASADAFINYRSKGTSGHSFQTNSSGSNEQFRVAHVADAVNYVQAQGAATTGAPIVRAAGLDTNIDLWLRGQGAGVARFGTHSAIGAETVTGYITIRDDGGTLRKLAVVA